MRMDNNSLSHFPSSSSDPSIITKDGGDSSPDPSIIVKDGDFYVNIPTAGIHKRRLDSEKYKKYKTLNNFCLFRILYQSESTKANSTHVSVAASDLWKSIPKRFKDDLQKYCDNINSNKRTFHFKNLNNLKVYNKPRICKKRINKSLAESNEKRWIQREEFMNKYFQDEINELNIVESEPCNFNSSQYFNIINDSRKAEFVFKPFMNII
jgi:hypothetical protein